MAGTTPLFRFERVDAADSRKAEPNGDQMSVKHLMNHDLGRSRVMKGRIVRSRQAYGASIWVSVEWELAVNREDHSPVTSSTRSSPWSANNPGPRPSAPRGPIGGCSPAAKFAEKCGVRGFLCAGTTPDFFYIDRIS